MVSGTVGSLGNNGGSELVRGVPTWGFHAGIKILHLSGSPHSDSPWILKPQAKNTNFSKETEEQPQENGSGSRNETCNLRNRSGMKNAVL